MKRVKERGAPTPGVTRGYLYVAERKKGTVGSWVRHYLEYHEEGDELHFYSINPVCFKGHISDKDLLKVKRESCTRCRTDEVERRFCFEIVASDKRTFLLQADTQVNINLCSRTSLMRTPTDGNKLFFSGIRINRSNTNWIAIVGTRFCGDICSS